MTTKTPKPTAAPIINLQALTASPAAPNTPVDDDPLLELDHPELRNQFNCPAPFPGYMQANYEQILQTAHRKQPHLSVAATLAGMAAQIPSCYSFEDGLRINIYLMGVASTATGKDHIRKCCNRLVHANAVGRATEMPSSHSGLYEEIEGVSKKLTKSEIDGGQPEKGEQPYRLDMAGKHLCFISDEIAILFKSMLADKAGVWDAKLVRLLLDFFSKSSEFYVNMQSLKGILGKHIPHPMISILGLAQPELLAAAFDEGDITSGLLGRFLLFRGETNPEVQKRVLPFKPVGDPFKPFTSRELDPLNKYSDEKTRPLYAERLISLPEELADGYQEEFLHRERIEDDKSIKAIYARSFEKIKRIAGILACFENREQPVVNQSMMDWAKALVLHTDENLVHLIEKEMRGNSAQAKENRRVLWLLKKFLNAPKKDLPKDLTAKELDLWKQGYMSRRRFMRSTNLSGRPFETVVRDLIDYGVIKADHRNGMEAFTAKK